MTVIQIFRDDGFPCGVCVSGHSGYAESGSDIVCAAVSVLIQTLHIGIVDVIGKPLEVHVDDRKALIDLRWRERSDDRVRVLAETVFRALRATAESYGDYVKLVEVSL